MRLRPTLSIIITNYNYANYLAAAIESALRQTRSPLEIIVIDDGSSDGSAEILARFAGRVQVVCKAGGGQASAFNAGYALARGDLIYFLDADDVAHPELVETVTAVWHDSLAAICFSLSLIDASGQHTGVFDVIPEDVDNRPGFLNTGGFIFSPTSANVFARRVLAQFMPMDEQRWRISADAALLRAATVTGRVMPLRRMLAAYRIHAHNNYYVQGASDLWRDRRDTRDITDLADAFAASPRYFGPASGLSADARRERDRQALALLVAGLRFRSIRAAMFDAGHGIDGALRRAAARFLTAPLPVRTRLGLSAALAGASLLSNRSERLRRWLGEPGSRPAIVVALLDLLGHRAFARFRAPVYRPRWQAPVEIGRRYDLTDSVEGFAMLRDGWRVRPQPGKIYIMEERASLCLTFNPSPAAHRLRLAFSRIYGDAAAIVGLRVRFRGDVLAYAESDGPIRMEVLLPAGTASAGGDVVLELEVASRGPAGLRSRIARAFHARASLMLESLMVLPAADMPHSAYGEDGISRPFGDLISQTEGAGFVALASGAGELREAGGDVLASVLQPLTPMVLTLDVPPGQPAGLMRIAYAGHDLFVGEWGLSNRILLDVPRSELAGHALVPLHFGFTPNDSFETRRPVIAAVHIRRIRTVPVVVDGPAEPDGVPYANPGQQLAFDEGSPGRGALGAGWHFEDGAAVAADGTAEIFLRLPPDGGGFDASLDVAPMLEPLEGMRHVLAIFDGGVPLAQVLLAGPAAIVVPLKRRMEQRRGILTLSVHSYLLAGNDPVPRPAALNLERIEFSPAEPNAASDPAPLPATNIRRHAGGFEAELKAAEACLDACAKGGPALRSDAATGQVLLRHRAALDRVMAQLDERALKSALVVDTTLTTLSRLSATIDEIFPGDIDRSLCLETWPAEGEGALRQALRAILNAPVWASPALAELDRLPAPLLWHGARLADVLTLIPPLIPQPAHRAAYLAFVERLVASADDRLGEAMPGSALRALAGAVIREIRPRHAIFGEATVLPLFTMLGRAIERLMHQEGYPLAWLPPASTSRERLHVGVILRAWRDEPEARIVKGLFADADLRLHLTRITLAPADPAADGEGFDETVNLAGLSIEEAVERLRGLKLDVVMLGSYFIGLDRLTAIVAHRLAPLQIATAAISPTSTGLSSFDVMLTSEALDPSGSEPGYLETIWRLPAPIQRFADLHRARPNAAVTRSHARAMADLPIDQTLYVSGAMAQKIGSDLLDVFARILAAVPDAILALYPFAPNWRTTFSPASFRRLVDEALRVHGLPPERIRVMPSLTPGEVSRLLLSADVYLDSFPYAGATTVIEALEQHCPVVALDGATQRGRQGAAWLTWAGLEADVATTVDGYVRRAVELGIDAGARDAVRARIAAYLEAGPAHRGSGASSSLFATELLRLAVSRGVTLVSPRPIDDLADTDDDGSAPRYVYHHMPKTAGTAAKTAFRSRFKLRLDYRGGWSAVPAREPFDLDALTENDLLCGHFELPVTRIERRYPALLSEPGWRLFTFVREPLELALSNYFFECERRANDPDFIDVGLSAYLRGPKDNYQEHFDFQPGDWRGRLDRYWFMGTVERLDECLAFLADSWDCTLPPLAIENATVRTEKPDPADVDVFVRNHADAYDIYNEVRRRLDARLSRR